VNNAEKFGQMFLAIGLFVGVMAIVLLIADRMRGKSAERVNAAAFLLPAVLLLLAGLLYPAVLTIIGSFQNPRGTEFVGFDNYVDIFTETQYLIVLRNTFLWVLLTPIIATGIGLLYAVLVDRARGEALAKAFIFLPVAISLVGASIIWKFVYEYRPEGVNQIGLANQILVWLGLDPYQFFLTSPWNTMFMIVIMIWIQAGFAMTVLSAAIKAIPDDMIEAARLDGVYGFKMFRFITVPSIRPALVVVVTTIGIATLKVFDIVRTTTGGQFQTSVMANEFYDQSFRFFNEGLGSAFAVLIFVLVIPIVIYNVRQLRKAEAR
jgi:alpha-glucoside transport system permease protein